MYYYVFLLLFKQIFYYYNIWQAFTIKLFLWQDYGYAVCTLECYSNMFNENVKQDYFCTCKFILS